MTTDLHVFANKSTIDWKSLIVRSLHQRDIEGCRFPKYTHIARLGSSDAVAGINEAFRFYDLCSPFLSPLLASRSCSYMDFGCGAGRIFRVFCKDFPQRQAIGVDCSSELIEICVPDFEDYEFQVIPDRPPTSLQAESLDVVTAYSVFSHFSGIQNTRWVDEFARLVRSGGLVFLTTYGEGHLAYLEHGETATMPKGHLAQRDRIRTAGGFSEIRRMLSIGEMVYFHSNAAAYNPYDYGWAYLGKGYIERAFGREFEVVDFIDDHSKMEQALIVLAKR